MRSKTTTFLAVFSTMLALFGGTLSAQSNGPILHLDDESLFFSVDDPSSALRLVVIFEGNPGDFLRFEPDGTVSIHFATNDALLLLIDLETGAVLGGPGSGVLSETNTCDLDDRICFPDGERTILTVQGELAPAPDAPVVASVRVHQVVTRGTERLFSFDVEFH